MKAVNQSIGESSCCALDSLTLTAMRSFPGRAIRHRNDYVSRALPDFLVPAHTHAPQQAALILLDRRYARPDIRNRLPGCESPRSHCFSSQLTPLITFLGIRNETKAVDKFGPAMASLGAFFRAKRK